MKVVPKSNQKLNEYLMDIKKRQFQRIFQNAIKAIAEFPRNGRVFILVKTKNGTQIKLGNFCWKQLGKIE